MKIIRNMATKKAISIAADFSMRSRKDSLWMDASNSDLVNKYGCPQGRCTLGVSEEEGAAIAAKRAQLTR